MNIRIVLLVLVGLWSCTPEPAVPETADNLTVVADTASRIDDYLQWMSDSAGFTGSVLLAVDGEIIIRKGYGSANDSLELPIDPHTVFTIGSITKQFTGGAILKLEEMGALSVDDPISKFFTDVPTDKQDITIHQLLTHSAGFPGAIGSDEDPIGTGDFLAQAMNTELLFEPGSAYEYSNVGYSLLGILVEQLSDQSYESFLHEHFFEPAGMTRTGYVLPDWSAETLAQGYRRGQRWGTLLDQPWREDGPGWHLRANGGILSTPMDMYRWHQALLDDEILSEASKEKYYGKHIEEGQDAGTFYGYGWAIFPTPRGTDLITHNGGNGIFFADMYRYLEEDVFLFFATNRGSRDVEEIPYNTLRMVFQPDFEPSRNNGPDGQVFEGFPDGPVGERLEAIVRLLQRGSDDALKSLVTEYMAPGMQEMAPMDQHLDVLRDISDQFGNLELRSTLASRQEFELHFADAEGNPVSLLIALNEEGAIVGING